MLSWLRRMTRKRDFQVRMIGRSEIVYTEQEGRRLSIYFEFASGGDHDMLIFLNREERWDGGAELSAEDRERIKERLKQQTRLRMDWPDW